MVGALQKVYNLSFGLAILLTVMAVILCGHGLQLDLHDLAKHNVIEHNGSLSHDDCSPEQEFASDIPNRKLLRRLVQRARSGHGLTLEDFSRARVERDSELTSPLDGYRSQIAKGESALTWLMMKNIHNEVPKEYLEEWYGEERIPHGWAPPTKSIGIFSAHRIAMMIGRRAK